MSEIRSRRGRPYFIPSGASTHPLGGLGFARWAFQVEEHETELDVVFDTVVVAVASGSTLGGMVAGFKLADRLRSDQGAPPRQRRLIGIEAFSKPVGDIISTVLQIARTAADKIGLDTESVSEDDFEVNDRFTAGAYGRLDEFTQAKMKQLASVEGVITDPVYTGKAMAGLMTMVEKGELAGSKHVLFCHTGGQTAISAYPSLQ